MEGIDDAHAVAALLEKYGWPLGSLGIKGSGTTMPGGTLVIDPTGDHQRAASSNDDGVLRSLGTVVERAINPVGAILDVDADRNLAQRWNQIRGTLEGIGMAVPAQADPYGYIGIYTASEISIPVGVWLMPDNRREGGIEAFLADLAGTGDPVFHHAQNSTQELIDMGHAKFTDAKRAKVEVRAFLAWQDEPGCRYGVAIRRRYFDGNPTAAQAFINWFTRLFGPPA